MLPIYSPAMKAIALLILCLVPMSAEAQTQRTQDSKSKKLQRIGIAALAGSAGAMVVGVTTDKQTITTYNYSQPSTCVTSQSGSNVAVSCTARAVATAGSSPNAGTPASSPLAPPGSEG